MSKDAATGRGLSKKAQVILEAEKGAEAIAGKFKAQKEFVKVVLECKDLTEQIERKLERREDIESELDVLIQNKKEFVEADGEVVRRFDEIEKRC